MTTDNPASAEQLAIALMAQARKLYEFPGSGSGKSTPKPFIDLADRLAGWASDVRKLGVDHHQSRSSWADQMSSMDQELRRARAKFSEAMEAKVQAGIEMGTERAARHANDEMLVALAVEVKDLRAKVARVREVMNGWQRLVAVHQLANKIKEASVSDLVRKVTSALHFGAPSAQMEEDLVEEVRGLVTANIVLERLVLRVRNLCEADGANPTVAAIRRAIDDGA